MFTNRIIKSNLAIDSIRLKIESLDLPYKDIGYENWDYEFNKPTPMPACYTFRFNNCYYVHIDLMKEKYGYEDPDNFGTDEYLTWTDDIGEIKFKIDTVAKEYYGYTESDEN